MQINRLDTIIRPRGLCSASNGDMSDEYVIEVNNQLGIGKPWRIHRRYAEFRKLNSQIEKFGADLGFPPKKFIGNVKEAFIKQRMLALQEFLDAICLYPILYACPAFTNFLESFTETYTGLHEWVLLSFRDKRQWMIEQQRKHCGWRPGKVHYEIRYGSSKLMLSGVRYGPDRFGTVTNLNSALEFLRTLQCPHLNESIMSWATDAELALEIKKQTVRDKEFIMDSSTCSFETYDIRLICRQLLETLTLLNAISIPYLDAHAGNVIITECGCELIDLDQVLTGQPSFRRPSMLCSQIINISVDPRGYVCVYIRRTLIRTTYGVFTFPVHSANEAVAIAPPIFRDLFIDIPVPKMKQREIRIPGNIKEVFDGLCNNMLERYKRIAVSLITSRNNENLNNSSTPKQKNCDERK
ncbi:PX domain-containing protein kinase-like protein [Dirofilaria immitis]|nr:PX domain-containing protein kinase-like protein [Dirofilaria immitis]